MTTEIRFLGASTFGASNASCYLPPHTDSQGNEFDYMDSSTAVRQQECTLDVTNPTVNYTTYMYMSWEGGRHWVAGRGILYHLMISL